ncbi:LLM class flavin-dependent oxidoreductase [Blastococcus sp. TML/M2B]|uniref:LLM class flavin-dependent oxidoreductase n=1 Tax=Blastococcus sp. TML/M2B TaxID=2798727 RepID=UPI0028150ED6|nr:LLM class flavin-dependent oxidoreductase [Blastococcus sp. TML/M2B]
MEKRIGFLSFGHWQPIPGSQVRTGRDALVQSVELAVAAEEIGLDGAYVRVHHFARQLASPFPLLVAMAARTSRIELGTGVIDMRYENPLYMAEEAAATDLLSDGRLQLGVSRGSPETALRGSEAFGYVPGPGSTDADLARQKTALFLAAISGQPVVDADPKMTGGRAGQLPVLPQSPGLADRIWWGSGTRATAEWTARQGMNLMSSTLLGRGHRRPLRRAPGRADRPVPQHLARGRLGARAEGVGEPQRGPGRQRPGPAVLRRRQRRGPGRRPRGCPRPLRQELRR